MFTKLHLNLLIPSWCLEETFFHIVHISEDNLKQKEMKWTNIHALISEASTRWATGAPVSRFLLCSTVRKATPDEYQQNLHTGAVFLLLCFCLSFLWVPNSHLIHLHSSETEIRGHARHFCCSSFWPKGLKYIYIYINLKKSQVKKELNVILDFKMITYNHLKVY